MPKSATLDQVTLCADGSIGLRWLKQVLDPDTGEILYSEPHRSVVDFDGDAEEQIEAVGAQLASLKYPADVARAKALVLQIDAIGKADPDIEKRRLAKIDAKAEAAKAALETAVQSRVDLTPPA